MMEPQISPLAKRLAEENSIDWRVIRGTGPEGRVIERDILTYLAKIMSGEIDPPAMPDASETPPPAGLAPDLGSISNLAAASAGMAREGIDLGSLLNAPAATPSTPSFLEPVPTPEPEVVSAPMSFEEPVAPVAQHTMPASSLESISFGDAPAPVVETPSSLESISFSDVPASEPVIAPVSFNEPPSMLETSSPALEVAVPDADLPEIASFEDSTVELTPVEVTPVEVPPVEIPAYTTSSFPPPQSPADSGVEFEIDLDDLDDLPEPVLETAPVATIAPVAVEPTEQEELILDVPADLEPVHVPAAASSLEMQESTFHDDLVIEELAPVISQTPVAAAQDDLLEDFEIDLDGPDVAVESVSLEPSVVETPTQLEPVVALTPVEPEPSHVFLAEPAIEEVTPSFTEPTYSSDAYDAPVEFSTPSFEAAEPAITEPVYAEAPVALEEPSPVIEEPVLETPAVPAFTPPVLESAAVGLAATSLVSSQTPAVSAASVVPGFYQGFAVRRHFDANGLTSIQNQLSKAMNGREVPLEVFLVRAAQRALHTLGGVDTVTLARLESNLEALNAPGLHHSFLEAVQSAARAIPGSAQGLMVLDASHLGVDDLVIPSSQPVLSLNVKGDHGHLSLAGHLDATKAAQFLGQVADFLEMPVSLVI
jgi:hypothetical protein